jgi:hypothetical protein
LQYSFWGDNDPDKNAHEIVTMLHSDNGWYDVGVAMNYYFLCEKGEFVA